MFPACEVLIDAECGPALPTVLVNHLRMIGTLLAAVTWCNRLRSPVDVLTAVSFPGGLNSFSRVDNSVVSAAAKLGAVLQRKLRVCERFSLCPLIEGRIVNVQDSAYAPSGRTRVPRRRVYLRSPDCTDHCSSSSGSTTTASDSNDLPPPKIELTRQLSDVVPGVGVDDRMAVPAGGTGGNGSVPSSSPLATAGHELAGTSLVLLHFNDVCVVGCCSLVAVAAC